MGLNNANSMTDESKARMRQHDHRNTMDHENDENKYWESDKRQMVEREIESNTENAENAEDQASDL